MINIKPNTYTQPTECREEVVQGICEAFLRGNNYSIFHPFQGCFPCYGETRYIVRHKGENTYYGFANERFISVSDIAVKFNGCEMKRAFEELRKAGYHIFKVRIDVGPAFWGGYEVSGKPFLKDGFEVTSFDDFID